MDVRELLHRVVRADLEARRILASHESAEARVITIEETYDRLGKLSIRQDDLIRQALRGIENALYRSAIVMAWAAFMDFAEEKLSSNKFKALNASYPDWKITDLDDLRDKKPDHQIVEALRVTKLCTKNEMKSIHGLLSVRNESAHPSAFLPDLNRALGFVSEILHRIEIMQPKKPSKRK